MEFHKRIYSLFIDFILQPSPIIWVSILYEDMIIAELRKVKLALFANKIDFKEKENPTRLTCKSQGAK